MVSGVSGTLTETALAGTAHSISAKMHTEHSNNLIRFIIAPIPFISQILFGYALLLCHGPPFPSAHRPLLLPQFPPPQWVYSIENCYNYLHLLYKNDRILSRKFSLAPRQFLLAACRRRDVNFGLHSCCIRVSSPRAAQTFVYISATFGLHPPLCPASGPAAPWRRAFSKLPVATGGNLWYHSRVSLGKPSVWE